MNCDEHFTWVACKPKQPGAYAAHTDDERYKDSLAIFKRREKRKGALVKRVTCNVAHALLAAWMNYTERREPQHNGDKK